MGYLVRYKNMGIHVSIPKWGIPGVFDHKIINLLDDNHWDRLCRQHPYANCVRTDLMTQLTGKHLRRTIPKLVKLAILDIPDVKILLREDKINDILNG